MYCSEPITELPDDQKILLKVYPFFMFLSALFLIATFIVYAILPEIRNLHGVCVMVMFCEKSKV